MRYVDNVMETITDGITVANLRRSDIQKVSTYDYQNYKHTPNDWHESTDGTIYFGSSKSNYSNPKYPKMWGDYDSKWTYGYNGTEETGNDRECEMWEREYGYTNKNEVQTGDINTEFKQSYYAHDYLNQENQFINKEYYNLLFKNEDGSSYLDRMYWLAGRYVLLFESCCDFGLQSVDAYSSYCYVHGSFLYNSNRLCG